PPALFVAAGAALVEAAAQVTLQNGALMGSDLGRAAVGLAIVAALSAVAAAIAAHSDVAATAAAMAAATAIGAVAEAAGIDGVVAASGASGALAAVIFGLVVPALAVARGRKVLVPAAAVAATSGVAATIAVSVNLAACGVTTPEAYVTVPGVAALVL